MSDVSNDTPVFDRTVAELKQGVAYATSAQAEAADKAAKTAKQFTAFGQGSFEAYMQASQILVTGSQALLRQMGESSQAAMAEAFSGFRALATAGSLKERIELQTAMSRTTANWAVSEANRFAHAGLELAEKAAAPLTARALVAAESFAIKA